MGASRSVTAASQEIERADPGDVVARVRDLHVTFERGGRRLHALRGVSLNVRSGEILGVVGESGSGKTVLGLTLLGLLPREPVPEVRGDVEVLGTDMLGDDRRRRRLLRTSLGAVFQDPATSLNPTMNVGRQIIEVTGSRDRAIELLRAVGIPDPDRRLRSYPHELSGGQQQRVMIAMAIANDPKLVVADEPTTALDVTVQREILRLIAQLRDDLGSSFVFVTHDLAVAAEIADRVIVLYGGRLMEHGAAEEVLGAPAHPYTIGLLASRLNLSSRRDGPALTLPGDVPDPHDPPPGCPFGPRCTIAIERCTQEPIPLSDVPDRGGAAACVRLEETGELRRTSQASEPWGSPVATGGLALFVRGLRKSYRVRAGGRDAARVQALGGVDLEVAEGEAVALVGESGSGKSTLLRILAGLERADEGELDVEAPLPQMVFQDALASLTPWLSVRELIGERLSSRGLGRAEADRRITDALQRTGLSAAIASARPRQLSGGQAQRVAIARAIVEPPGLLLADEPTSSLDISLRAVILNLLNALRRELGLAMVFVTHDLSAARLIADRIAVMYLGRIVEVGRADDVTDRPAHPYTRDLIASLPGEGTDRLAAAGEPPDPADVPSGCPYHPRCTERIERCPSWEPVLLPVPGTASVAACIHLEAGDGPR